MAMVFFIVIGFPVILFFGTCMYKGQFSIAFIYGMLATIWSTVFYNKYVVPELDFVFKKEIDIIVLYIIPIIFLITVIERMYNYKKKVFNN